MFSLLGRFGLTADRSPGRDASTPHYRNLVPAGQAAWKGSWGRQPGCPRGEVHPLCGPTARRIKWDATFQFIRELARAGKESFSGSRERYVLSDSRGQRLGDSSDMGWCGLISTPAPPLNKKWPFCTLRGITFRISRRAAPPGKTPRRNASVTWWITSPRETCGPFSYAC